MLSSLQASLDTLLPVCVTVCQPGVIHLLSESSSHILTYAHKRTCWTQTDTNTQTDSLFPPTRHIRNVHRVSATLVPCVLKDRKTILYNLQRSFFPPVSL